MESLVERAGGVGWGAEGGTHEICLVLHVSERVFFGRHLYKWNASLRKFKSEQQFQKH